MLLFVLLLAVRLFHPVTIDQMATTTHTHVKVSGTVALVRKEADGDVHIRLEDEHRHFVVAEIVPFHPLPMPKKGTVITVYGIKRYDNEAGHGWWECHPVENWVEGVQ